MPSSDGHRTHWTLPGAPWKKVVAGKVYIAGPMTGYRFFNFDQFDQAAAILRRAGWEVFSPAEHDRSGGLDETLYPTGSIDDLLASGFDMRLAFRWDIDRIFEADAIALLDGHPNSTGAKAELAVARMIRLRELVFIHDEYTGNVVDYYEAKK